MKPVWVKLMFTVPKLNILDINCIRSEYVHRKVTRKLFEFVSSFRSKTLETSIYSGAEQCTAVHDSRFLVSRITTKSLPDIWHQFSYLLESWCKDYRNMQEIDIPRYFFELPANSAYLEAPMCSVAQLS